MATSDAQEVPSAPLSQEVPKWKLAKQGINLLINNKQEEAEALFKQYPDSLQMYAGYSFAVFINALTTFEDDKLAEALSCLKETEKRCAMQTGWLKSMKTRVFGVENAFSHADDLETQIILADSQLCIATLTFLQQDIAGFFKGGWVLRKSWKVYQHVYNEISELYKKTVGDLHLPGYFVRRLDAKTFEHFNIDLELPLDPASDVAWDSSCSRVSDCDWEIPTEDKLNNTSSTTNGYIRHRNIPHSYTTTFVPPSSSSLTPDDINLTVTSNSPSSVKVGSLIKKSTSINSALSNQVRRDFRFLGTTFNTNLSLSSLLTSNFNIFSTSKTKLVDVIDKETVARLMGAVSFGYGLFQLGISLLPPSLLKLSNILGFGGNKQNGIECLMYARLGTDMRAPLATLALLWYHTILRPFYALDGSNVQAGVEVSMQLIEESSEYKESSLFLFFTGRVKRLNSEISEALAAFQMAVEKSNQRELKILSMHEVGWCYLIQLNYMQANATFQSLITSSRWSKAFYAFLASICAGSRSAFKDSAGLQEIIGLLETAPKSSQLEEFLQRRFRLFRKESEVLPDNRPFFWKLMVYEVLYLWNTLPSCSADDIRNIIIDCDFCVNERNLEPMLGLSDLVGGSSRCILKEFEAGIASFRQCLEIRKNIPNNADDAHISAFAQFELGAILLKNPETKEEGKALLQQTIHYKDYDFEPRLTVRIHSMLKHL